MNRSAIFTVLFHLAGWILFYSMIIAFISVSPEGGKSSHQIFSFPFIQFYFIFPAIFYCNRFVFIPYLFLKKNYIVYFIVIALIFLLVFWLKPFDQVMNSSVPEFDRPPGFPGFGDSPPPPKQRQGFDIMSTILFLLVWLFSSAVFVFREWRRSEQRVLQAEADKANAELSFLKAQVNPHFLFNTLNNIYSMAVTKSEHTAESIMKLSNIMRYVTDDAGEHIVSLLKEADCIKDYVDLQKLRLGKNTEVIFEITGDIGKKQIAPLLFMSFVENAFKYGVSNHEPSAITIRLQADEKKIYFETVNKLFESKKTMERTGVGQANALQRLSRLYHQKHSIDISTAGGFYTVQLTLED